MPLVGLAQVPELRCCSSSISLVTNGNRDRMIPTINSFTLSEHLPNAQLIIYPDSGHRALFQHAGAFTSHVLQFLDRSDALVVQKE